MYGFIGIIGGLVFFFFFIRAMKMPSDTLQKKFISLGNIIGKTYQEIAAVVGLANAESPSVTADGEPATVRQWFRTDYNVSLVFDQNNICVGKSQDISI